MSACLACDLGPGYPKVHNGIGPRCPKITATSPTQGNALRASARTMAARPGRRALRARVAGMLEGGA